jgi:hypothetical protein
LAHVFRKRYGHYIAEKVAIIHDAMLVPMSFAVAVLISPFESKRWLRHRLIVLRRKGRGRAVALIFDSFWCVARIVAG